MLPKTFIMFVIVFCFSCHNDECELQLLVPRTVLVYMVAGNNLYKNAKEDIAEMLAVTTEINGNLLVYLDAPDNSVDSVPKLIKIQNGKIQILKKYEQQNSASREVLELVINDVMTTFPTSEYGLVLWSHGTGWLPEGIFNSLKKKVNSVQRTFGLDNDNEMEFIELSQALPNKFEFILFDACLMGNIEVLYQLRNKANYIIASPTETLVAGFPYTQTIPLLFQNEIDYSRVAETYVNYYECQSKSVLKSASLSVIQTVYLNILVDFIKQSINNKNITLSDSSQSQFYEVDKPILYFDFFYLLSRIVLDKSDRNKLNLIKSKLIVNYQHTDYFLDDLSLENTSGLSVFVFPLYNESLLSVYKQTDWYIETGLLLNR